LLGLEDPSSSAVAASGVCEIFRTPQLADVVAGFIA